MMKKRRTWGRRIYIPLLGLALVLYLLLRPVPCFYTTDRLPKVSNPVDAFPENEKIGVMATSKTSPPFHIWLFPPEEDIISKKIMETGVYENEETIFLKSIAALSTSNNSGWAVDIGANVGFHSLHMAALGMKVISFEPSPDTARLLAQSVKSNSFDQGDQAIHIIQAAASEEKGFGRLIRHSSSPGMTILQKDGDSNNLPFGVETVVGEGIPLVRPEDVLSGILQNPQPQNLRLLKIDAEGHELHAFRGVNLNKFPFTYVTFEFFPELLWKAGQTEPLDLLLYLQSFGYNCGTNPLHIQSEEKLMTTEKDYAEWYNTVSVPSHQKNSGYHVNFYCKKSMAR